ncbi:hypothetical protein AB0C01_29465, partial [Micromonospora sp. NPDC048905]
MIPPRIRRRRATDLDGCVAALAEVHRVDRYPLNWPTDPHRWLREPHPARAWVAIAADATAEDANANANANAAIVGHVSVHRLPGPSVGPPARSMRCRSPPARRTRTRWPGSPWTRYPRSTGT